MIGSAATVRGRLSPLESAKAATIKLLRQYGADRSKSVQVGATVRAITDAKSISEIDTALTALAHQTSAGAFSGLLSVGGGASLSTDLLPKAIAACTLWKVQEQFQLLGGEFAPVDDMMKAAFAQKHFKTFQAEVKSGRGGSATTTMVSLPRLCGERGIQAVQAVPKLLQAFVATEVAVLQREDTGKSEEEIKREARSVVDEKLASLFGLADQIARESQATQSFWVDDQHLILFSSLMHNLKAMVGEKHSLPVIGALQVFANQQNALNRIVDRAKAVAHSGIDVLVENLVAVREAQALAHHRGLSAAGVAVPPDLDTAAAKYSSALVDALKTNNDYFYYHPDSLLRAFALLNDAQRETLSVHFAMQSPESLTPAQIQVKWLLGEFERNASAWSGCCAHYLAYVTADDPSVLTRSDRTLINKLEEFKQDLTKAPNTAQRTYAPTETADSWAERFTAQKFARILEVNRSLPFDEAVRFQVLKLAILNLCTQGSSMEKVKLGTLGLLPEEQEALVTGLVASYKAKTVSGDTYQKLYRFLSNNLDALNAEQRSVFFGVSAAAGASLGGDPSIWIATLLPEQPDYLHIIENVKAMTAKDMNPVSVRNELLSIVRDPHAVAFAMHELVDADLRKFLEDTHGLLDAAEADPTKRSELVDYLTGKGKKEELERCIAYLHLSPAGDAGIGGLHALAMRIRETYKGMPFPTVLEGMQSILENAELFAKYHTQVNKAYVDALYGNAVGGGSLTAEEAAHLNNLLTDPENGAATLKYCTSRIRVVCGVDPVGELAKHAAKALENLNALAQSFNDPDSPSYVIYRECEEMQSGLREYREVCELQKAGFSLTFKPFEVSGSPHKLAEYFPTLSAVVKKDDVKISFFRQWQAMHYLDVVLPQLMKGSARNFFEANFSEAEYLDFAESIRAKFAALRGEADNAGIAQYGQFLKELYDLRYDRKFQDSPLNDRIERLISEVADAVAAYAAEQSSVDALLEMGVADYLPHMTDSVSLMRLAAWQEITVPSEEQIKLYRQISSDALVVMEPENSDDFRLALSPSMPTELLVVLAEELENERRIGGAPLEAMPAQMLKVMLEAAAPLPTEVLEIVLASAVKMGQESKQVLFNAVAATLNKYTEGGPELEQLEVYLLEYLRVIKSPVDLSAAIESLYSQLTLDGLNRLFRIVKEQCRDAMSPDTSLEMRERYEVVLVEFVIRRLEEGLVDPYTDSAELFGALGNSAREKLLEGLQRLADADESVEEAVAPEDDAESVATGTTLTLDDVIEGGHRDSRARSSSLDSTAAGREERRISVAGGRVSNEISDELMTRVVAVVEDLTSKTTAVDTTTTATTAAEVAAAAAKIAGEAMVRDMADIGSIEFSERYRHARKSLAESLEEVYGMFSAPKPDTVFFRVMGSVQVSRRGLQACFNAMPLSRRLEMLRDYQEQLKALDLPGRSSENKWTQLHSALVHAGVLDPRAAQGREMQVPMVEGLASAILEKRAVKVVLADTYASSFKSEQQLLVTAQMGEIRGLYSRVADSQHHKDEKKCAIRDIDAARSVVIAAIEGYEASGVFGGWFGAHGQKGLRAAAAFKAEINRLLPDSPKAMYEVVLQQMKADHPGVEPKVEDVREQAVQAIEGLVAEQIEKLFYGRSTALKSNSLASHLTRALDEIEALRAKSAEPPAEKLYEQEAADVAKAVHAEKAAKPVSDAAGRVKAAVGAGSGAAAAAKVGLAAAAIVTAGHIVVPLTAAVAAAAALKATMQRRRERPVGSAHNTASVFAGHLVKGPAAVSGLEAAATGPHGSASVEPAR